MPLAVTQAKYFDGRSAVSHEVTVELNEGDFKITFRDGHYHQWYHDEIKYDGFSAQYVSVHRKYTTEFIEISDPAFNEILIRTSRRPWFRAIPLNRMKWFVVLLLAAAALMFALYLSLQPLAKFLAHQIPFTWEQNLAKKLLQFEKDATCNRAEGLQALLELQTRLRGQFPFPLDLRVVKQKSVNAFALPGGTILINSGLIDFAKSPDEVAGVLAHEMGHVYHRHIVTSLIRSSMVAVIFAAAAGDMSGFLIIDPGTAGQIASLSFSRSMESEADLFAIQAMRHAQINVNGGRDFFRKLKDTEPFKLPAIISTHPDTEDRESLFAQAATEQGQELTPALSESQWLNLKNICLEF